ncbi:MAG: hypothetical protein CO095_01505, partial [Armatimonadetes bacterium CG_4_9_14_3_um_filter_58_7]
ADIDECSEGTAGCAVDATCTNTEGGFDCTCTPPLVGDGLTCVEPTCCGQCPGTMALCDPNATCTTQSGSYEVCLCNSGFAGDGLACADVDECVQGTNNCHANATCT